MINLTLKYNINYIIKQVKFSVEKILFKVYWYISKYNLLSLSSSGGLSRVNFAHFCNNALIFIILNVLNVYKSLQLEK
jgi:hypothetical protein